MKISFADLEQWGTTIPLVNDGWFPSDEITLLDGPSGQTTATLTGSSEALVEGGIRCTIESSCDRCCRSVKLKIAADFAYICMVGGEEYDQRLQETECREEDYNRLYLTEPVIDLGEIWREQVYLGIPSRILCDESCRGLCQVCGIDLNLHQCTCQPDEQNSPFSVLGQLKNR